MTYEETLKWLFLQLPMYQREGKSAYKASLASTLKFDIYLGHPHKAFKTIHVAGTNGKGSTSHMLASVLQEAGYKVGLYTSPHLKDFRERIKVNGVCIPKCYVIEFVELHRAFFNSNSLSFFELTVGLAFAYFAASEIDIAVVEVGLGGRLDSTNIISPDVSVITNIGLDHTQFLGTTLAEIALEKAGIIKPKTPVVIGETQKETEAVFIKKAKSTNSTIHFADKQRFEYYETDLLGNYQNKNKNTVLATLQVLTEKGYSIPRNTIVNGLKHVVVNTGLLGRWQQLGQKPKIIADVAHNAEGLQLVINQIKSESFSNLHIVFGSVKDKSLNEIMQLLPMHATYYLCKPDIPRGMEVDDLSLYFKQYKLNANSFTSVKKAFETAKENAKPTDFIYVGGSTFVVAEII